MFKTAIKISIILASAFIFFSCSNDTVNNSTTTPVDSSQFKFPLNVGYTWGYTRQMKVSNIRPDSIRHYFSSYPINGSGTLTVLYDTIVNSIPVKCVFEKFNIGTDSAEGRTYFQNTDTALLVHAWRGNRNFNPYSKLHGINFMLPDGRKYDPLSGILSVTAGSETTASDSLHLVVPPRVTMVYPIHTGTEWTENEQLFGTFFTRYNGFENLTINNLLISCVRVNKWWSNMNGVTMFAYFSKYGPMKSGMDGVNMQITNEFGAPIGMVDNTDYSTVTSFPIIIGIPK